MFSKLWFDLHRPKVLYCFNKRHFALQRCFDNDPASLKRQLCTWALIGQTHPSVRGRREVSSTLLGQGSVHSGSVSREDCGLAFLDELRVACVTVVFPLMSGQHSLPTPALFVNDVCVCSWNPPPAFFCIMTGVLYVSLSPEVSLAQEVKGRKFSCHSCWGVNPWPFTHASSSDYLNLLLPNIIQWKLLCMRLWDRGCHVRHRKVVLQNRCWYIERFITCFMDSWFIK